MVWCGAVWWCGIRRGVVKEGKDVDHECIKVSNRTRPGILLLFMWWQGERRERRGWVEREAEGRISKDRKKEGKS